MYVINEEDELIEHMASPPPPAPNGDELAAGLAVFQKVPSMNHALH